MKEVTKKILVSNNLDQTSAIGLAIGEALQPSTLIGLVGSLGAGKTNLTQGIGEAIGALRTDIVSPTFTIMVPHMGRLPLIHLDAYRIKSPEEVDELGLDEVVSDGGVLVVEWSDRIADLLPTVDLSVQIQHVDDEQRRFLLTASSERGRTLLAAVEHHFSG